MKPKFIPSHSRISSEPLSLKPRSIKFIDPGAINPDAPLLGPGLAPTHPSSPHSVVKRSNTLCVSEAPRPTGTFNVEGHPRLRRAPPIAQFEMVTPPRSPIDTSQVEGPRPPVRTTTTNDVKRRSTIARGNHQGTPATGTGAPGAIPTTPLQHCSPTARSSMIPVRKGLSILGWNESRASFAALNTTPSSRVPGRGALPSAWTGIPSQKPNRYGHHTLPVAYIEPVAKIDPHCARNDSESKSGEAYPQLTIKEQNILVRKLKLLLKHTGIETTGLDDWEKLAGFQREETGRSGGVFGTSVIASSAYASCQVVLGEHSHALPVCVFATIEEICRRGMTMPALFRVASPLNERTLEHLTQLFDRGPSYGANISLSSEDIPNICALLKLYLRGLPIAVLSPSLWPILQRLASESGPARIAAFQAILHLQRPAHFSLLVYVLAFLHQLVRHGSENGLDTPTLAAMFGPALFSPRKGSDPGSLVSPTLDGPRPVVVKTFLSTRDVDEGTRVMNWVLNHWDEIATGLLSLGIVHGSEKDIQAWEASFAPTSESGSIRGRLFRTPDGGSAYSEGPSIDELVDPALERLPAFPFPENVTFDHVPVHEVRDSIVDMPELPPRSTHASSPATLWSQETASQAMTSRTSSFNPTTAKLDLQPKYVQDLRLRMDAQEAELASLRQELHMIRSRFVFPLPPSDMLGLVPDPDSGTNKPGFKEEELDTRLDNQDGLDEDTMPTPRPLAGSQFATMRALVDSLQSQPVTPLHPRAIGEGFTIRGDAGNTNAGDKHSASRDSGYSTHLYQRLEEDIPQRSSLSDPEPSISPPSHEVSFRMSRDVEEDAPTNPKDDASTKDIGKFQELLTARDALRSALAAMDPVKAQLQAVEDELKLRDPNPA